MQSEGNEDESLERLVSLVTDTNLLALNKTLRAIESNSPFAFKAAQCHRTAERMCRAVHEVGLTLPHYKR